MCEIEDKAEELKGAAKEHIGDATDDESMRAEGAAERPRPTSSKASRMPRTRWRTPSTAESHHVKGRPRASSTQGRPFATVVDVKSRPAIGSMARLLGRDASHQPRG